MSREVDTKLARRLQKRNRWESYTACLRAVQVALAGEKTVREIKDMIDRGELDPK